MIKKYLKMTYSNSGNLGDHIQTIATQQFLPSINGEVERDQLENYKGDSGILLMQGWFGQSEKFNMFPPSDPIDARFVGFHISDSNIDRNFYSQKHIINYLKNKEPIGCRDKDTASFLAQHGINTFFSGCLTTTFPTRKVEPKNDKIFIVDCIDNSLIPKRIANRAEYLTHFVDEQKTQKAKEALAHNLLNRYKNEATLVITSRLHCASPCIAMGIPVIFIGNANDVRFSAISDILKINHYQINSVLYKYRLLKPLQIIHKLFFKIYVDWNPNTIDLKDTKQSITKIVKKTLEFKV